MADLSELEAFMAAIRKVESGGRYKAQGPSTKYGRATGAYQFLDSTWAGYGGYKRAMDAPPEVQDARARQLMSTYFNSFGSWRLVAIAWHAGPGAARKAARNPNYAKSIRDVNISTDQYANRVVGGMKGGGMGPGNVPPTPTSTESAAPASSTPSRKSLLSQYASFIKVLESPVALDTTDENGSAPSMTDMWSFDAEMIAEKARQGVRR